MRRDRRGPSNVAWGRTMCLMVLLVLAQVTLLDQLNLGGVLRIDLPLLFVVALAALARADHAAVVGFATGLFVDLFQLGPFGQHSLVYCVVAYAIAAGLDRAATAERADGTFGRSRSAARLHRAGRQALLAGTATIAVACASVLVQNMVVPAWPSLADVSAGLPLGALAGAVIGIQLVALILRRINVVPGLRSNWAGDGSWPRRTVPVSDPWTSSLSPVRRL